jgi:hypothetical protein
MLKPFFFCHCEEGVFPDDRGATPWEAISQPSSESIQRRTLRNDETLLFATTRIRSYKEINQKDVPK